MSKYQEDDQYNKYVSTKEEDTLTLEQLNNKKELILFKLREYSDILFNLNVLIYQKVDSERPLIDVSGLPVII
tara:strand:+ start:818 stop:1036 length:219 start_codon:yes stop_codon:yes gene_type:complete